MDSKFIENILYDLRILYIEGDKKFSDGVTKALSMKCKNVFPAHDIQEAANIYNSNSIDIIITELVLENKNTINFIKSIRNINKLIPIIMISKVKNIDFFLELVKLNLTDYILKPIDLKVLRQALYKSVIDIYDNGLYEVHFSNGARYNYRKKMLFNENENLPLSSKEVRLLDILLYNKQALLPKENLKDMIWENEYDITDEAFKSLLNRLRKKIGKESIENVSSSGYLIKIK